MRRKMILEISFQHKNQVEEAMEYNKKNNYKFIIVDTNNLIDCENLKLMLRFGYVLNEYSDNVELRHKNYDREIEKDFGGDE